MSALLFSESPSRDSRHAGLGARTGSRRVCCLCLISFQVVLSFFIQNFPRPISERDSRPLISLMMLAGHFIGNSLLHNGLRLHTKLSSSHSLPILEKIRLTFLKVIVEPDIFMAFGSRLQDIGDRSSFSSHFCLRKSLSCLHLFSLQTFFSISQMGFTLQVHIWAANDLVVAICAWLGHGSLI